MRLLDLDGRGKRGSGRSSGAVYTGDPDYLKWEGSECRRADAPARLFGGSQSRSLKLYFG